MSSQNILKTLKTAQKVHIPKRYRQAPPSSIPKPQLPTSSSALSDLNPTTLHQILANPFLQPSQSLQVFDLVLKNPSLVAFTPDLQAHLTLVCRFLQAKRFSDAENLLRAVSVEENARYPFSVLASTVERCCCVEPEVVAKFFNLTMKVYSDCEMFDQVLRTFDHCKNNGIEIDERTCTVHLLALKRDYQIGALLDFFNRMVESGVEISVYSLTVVVDGLCRSGEIKRCRELLEEMMGKGIKPNIITYNLMVDACAKRWNFEELNSVLALMEKEGQVFDLKTYKSLIDGYSSSGRIEEADKLLLKMHDQGFTVEAHTYNLIMSGYAKLGFMDKAISLFDKMTGRGVGVNADTYWVLINGLCRLGRMEAAMVYASKMRLNGIELDQSMFNVLISGYYNNKMVHEAFALLIEMERMGYDVEVSLCCEIASELCKLNQLAEARMLVNILVERGGSFGRARLATSIRTGGGQFEECLGT
ncbi:hypothetical protein Tsubulata_002472 [Turnera subulata]|uniref:Pentacotripeptide-repeat region of PRORP domain-containing protein n=1 Tax=Turnera subulata TaxID=218843 RepID=A0A9Q0F8Y5_9ROSI|nr:hypothetical protein Tsubulata_002472 [Turnera subulata]